MGQLGLGDTFDRYVPCRLGSPAPPSSLIAIAVSSSQINLSWIDNSFNETGFELERSTDGMNYVLLSTLNANPTGGGTSYSNTPVLSGTVYYYRIKAYNAYGESPYSNETNTQTVFLPPSNLIVQANSSTQIDLSWIDNTPDEDEFKIERKIGRNGTYELLGTTSADIITYSDITPGGFTPNTYYYYRVKAWSFFTESLYSNEVCMAVSENWSKITNGNYYTILLKNDNTVWACGMNDRGQLGQGDITNRNTPTQIETDSSWSNLAAGFSHTFGLKSNGTLWAWGNNSVGQLGLGDSGISTYRTTPTQVTTNTDWSIISAGSLHSLGLKTNPDGSVGTLWSWGYNNKGQLGIGNTINRNTPIQTGTDSDWTNITAGEYHTLGLKSNSTLWSWGYNDKGQLGLGDVWINRNTPTQIGTDSDWTNIMAGGSCTLGLKSNNTLWSWGNNYSGQLGQGDITDRNTPSQVGTESDWSNLAAGYNHTLGLKNNGTIWAWGNNSVGQLGIGGGGDRNTPTQIGIDTDWVSMAVGFSHTLGLKNNGTLWAWGFNASGQLGLGDGADRNTPTLISE
jgi:hypothetical protein